MIILPYREKLIQKNFFEYSFNEDEDFVPNKRLFNKLSSAEQYYLAENFNWDDGVDVLNWIVESKKCDKGTAALIFWKADPDFYMERTLESIEDYERGVFDLLQKILRKFNNDEFTRSKLKFDPIAAGYDTNVHSQHKIWELPNELRCATKGMKPISLGGIQEFFWEWQRSQRLKKREKRKAKRKQSSRIDRREL
ncbi:DUF4274 domain-containing protein [Fulvivirga sediminis]|uniref:DUF4274 domain-containing protein n=1 Tax=Fulvivirga sediminis TaxID=2803949 RepID=A0A937K170_9BACT|nr:DUF4274 domain-containing protein [Fulvivirga sediminis]MBL3659063.1 DUF4274 domain-containing protein [Fulvivirga sediminis]